MKTRLWTRLALFLVCFSICVTSYAAPILIVNADGILTGARGVTFKAAYLQDVGPWDVDFVDGTCAEVFGACNGLNFPLQQFDNDIATMALLSTVFVDGPAGMFDSFPNRTLGCTGAGVTVCKIITPDMVSNFSGPRWSGAAVVNSLGPCQGLCYGSESDFISTDLSGDPTRVWARWTQEPVPEPLSLSTLGIALLFLIAVGYRCGNLSFRDTE